MEDSVEELVDIGSALKGEALLEVFKDHGITAESLKYMSKGHLDTIVPTNLFGVRIIFEHNLRQWQQSNIEPTITECVPDLDANYSVCDENFSAETILQKTQAGQTIIKFYAANQFLNTKYRRQLSNCIKDYLMQRKINTSPKIFDEIAVSILKLFPRENKAIYYLHHKGKKPTGCLYSNYHNSKGRLKKEGLWETPAQEVTDDVGDKPEFSPTVDVLASKDWLLYNIEPIEEVFNKWDDTFDIRQQYIKQGNSLKNILENWPILKQAFGYKLVKADFSKLYAGKENLVFQKWDIFSTSLMKLCASKLKDADNLEIINKYNDPNFAENRNSILFHLVHEIIRPNSRKCVITENKKRKFTKVTVADSRDSFLLWAPTTSELQTNVKVRIDQFYLDKTTLQPIICYVGSTRFDIEATYVYYADIFYKTDNIVIGLDICFKLFHVLDLEYPHECKNVWMFLQDFIYDIPLKDSDKNSTLATILTDIKNQ